MTLKTSFFIPCQVSEKIQQMLHVKSEDLRLYDLTVGEDTPKLLEDEEITIVEMCNENSKKVSAKEGFKLLVEST